MQSYSWASLVRRVIAVLLFSSACLAQVKPRIAVFPFDDRTTANADMKIGTKVADLLISKLTANGAFTVFDRQYVDKILEENHRKYDPNYDSASAAKAGLLGTVDLVVTGQIDAYNASTKENNTNTPFGTRHVVDGTVSLKVTARLLSVEKASIVAAPDAANDQKVVLCTATTVKGFGNDACAKSEDNELRKLVDQATDEVAKKLSEDINPVAAKIQPVVSPILASPRSALATSASGTDRDPMAASCVGVSEGVVYIDKWAADGVKVGDKFVLRRSKDTGLKDSKGNPILSHKPVCTVVIETVENGSAGGKCTPDPPTKKGTTDATPRKGDQVMLSLNSPTSSK